ncbi:hypothetical protein ACS0TY_013300 [Phlomoides rotata]
MRLDGCECASCMMKKLTSAVPSPIPSSTHGAPIGHHTSSTHGAPIGHHTSTRRRTTNRRLHAVSCELRVATHPHHQPTPPRHHQRTPPRLHPFTRSSPPPPDMNMEMFPTESSSSSREDCRKLYIVCTCKPTMIDDYDDYFRVYTVDLNREPSSTLAPTLRIGLPYSGQRRITLIHVDDKECKFCIVEGQENENTLFPRLIVYVYNINLINYLKALNKHRKWKVENGIDYLDELNAPFLPATKLLKSFSFDLGDAEKESGVFAPFELFIE